MSEQSNANIIDIYASFETDVTKERTGVPVNYGRFVVDLARAGGSNFEYAKVFELVFKDVKTALELGELPEEDARIRFYQVYARSVIKRWRFRDVDNQLIDGLGRDAEGKVVEFNEANVIALFSKRHDLFIRLRKDAEQMEVFQTQTREAIAKN